MRYETIHNTLKQSVDKNKLNSCQIEKATKEDIAAMIGADIDAKFWSGGNEGFFINLKRNIVIEKQRQEKQKELDGVKQLLLKNYPQCDVVWNVDGVIELFLDGRSEDIVDGK